MHASQGRGRGRCLPPLLSLVLSGLLVWPAVALASPVRSGIAKLQILSRSPVLVRAGERVRIPVDVVCATDRGTACRPAVTLRIGSARTGWRTERAAPSMSLRFDATTPSRRAVGTDASGSVAYRVKAEAGGTSTTLPGTGEGSGLRYYVARSIPTSA